MPITDPLLLARAKEMRSNPTPAEARLWYALRAKRFEGAKFSRQVVVGRAICDFAARSCGLVIEVDGDTHVDEAREERRTELLNSVGYRVIRFTNAEVMGNIDGVLQVIGEALATAPLPDPLPGGEREQGA